MDHEIRTRNARVILDLALALFGLLYWAYCAAYMFSKLIRLLSDAFLADYPPQRVLSILLSLLVVLIMAFCVLSAVIFFWMAARTLGLLSLRIQVSDERIEIISRKDKCIIKRSDILHILGQSSGPLLVWQMDNSPVTFNITEKLFGTKVLEKTKAVFGEFDVYVEEEKAIRQIRKRLNLDHIFRKNRYEFQLGKKVNSSR
jgi:predicted PurR-regulated permease PerM